jgi:hypothetical protein
MCRDHTPGSLHHGCIRKAPSASIAALLENAQSGSIGTDSSAQITITRRYPIFSDSAPRAVPPTIAPTSSITAMVPTT